jgi:hypothetical protein
MTDTEHRERSASPPRHDVVGGHGRDGHAADAHLDALLDEALEATFPASDPIALSSPPA